MWNLHRRFDCYYLGQIYSGDFAKICGLLRIYELYRRKYIFPVHCADILCTGISKWITFCYFSEIVSIVITKQFWVRFSHHSYCAQCTPDTLTCSIWLIFQLFDEDGLCAPDIYFCFSIGNWFVLAENSKITAWVLFNCRRI